MPSQHATAQYGQRVIDRNEQARNLLTGMWMPYLDLNPVYGYVTTDWLRNRASYSNGP